MKKVFLTIVWLCICFISFCNAWSYTISWQLVWNRNGAYIPIPLNVYSNNGRSTPNVYLTCSFSCNDYYLNMRLFEIQNDNEYQIGSFFYCDSPDQVFSISATTYLIKFKGSSSSYTVNYICNITWDNIGATCPTCPEVDTWAILSWYVSESLLNSCQSDLNSCNSSLSGCQSSLSSCQSYTSWFNDQLNYCNSELVSCNSSLTSCLQYNCPETELSYSKFYVRHWESTWSQLTWTENYYVYLPEYLGYNYEYSNWSDLDFTVWVATDTWYINNINAIQNSKPSQWDLNKLVSEVLPLFVPWLAVILLLYFIFRFIKKIF